MNNMQKEALEGFVSSIKDSTLFDGFGLICTDKQALAGKTTYTSAGKITYPKDYPNSPVVFSNLSLGIKMIIPETNWSLLIK